MAEYDRRYTADVGTGTGARVEVVGSLFQVWSGGAVTAFATGVGAVPGLFVGLLLEGFYVAPRGMGAIPAIATPADVDDLAAAVGRVVVGLEQAPAMAPEMAPA